VKAELCVFDIAGTTVRDDNFVGQCLAHALAAVDVHPTLSQLNSIMGIPKPVAIAELAALEGKCVDVPTVYADFECRMVEFYRTAEFTPIDGTEDAIRRLTSAGIKVYLDTGFAKAVTESVLDRLGWHDLVSGTVSSDEVERGRPNPDLIHLAMERAGVTDVRAVCKAGDTPSDLGEGTAAGCTWVVGVLSGTHTREELESHPHTHILDSIAAIPDLLGV